MSDSVWLRRPGYALSIQPSRGKSPNEAFVYVGCPGGNISFSIGREALIRFVEELTSAFTEDSE